MDIYTPDEQAGAENTKFQLAEELYSIGNSCTNILCLLELESRRRISFHIFLLLFALTIASFCVSLNLYGWKHILLCSVGIILALCTILRGADWYHDSKHLELYQKDTISQLKETSRYLDKIIKSNETYIRKRKTMKRDKIRKAFQNRRNYP